jgi:tetratricopeptide (TPR) repeat protein
MSDAPQTSRKGPLLTAVLVAVLVCVLLSHKKQQPAQEKSALPSPVAQKDDPRIWIETEPAGASLLVNGKLVGSTPIRIEGLAPGQYGVRLEKDGCEPVALKVDYSGENLTLKRKMDPLPTGSLSVTVNPEGSEVLLDGDVVGYTPLNLARVTTGAHQLLVRKTNYDSYASSITINPGARSTYSGFELHSQILAMLEGYVKREPQRVSHYIDLAHFHFVNDHTEKAVEMFAQAMEVNSAPLNFDGPGYPGKANVSDAEMAQDERLRKYDDQRLLKEVEKHKNWPGKDCREFRQKLDAAQEQAITRNGASWDMVDNAARNARRQKDFDKAELIYRSFIATHRESPDAARAYSGLLEVALMQRDIASVRKQFNTFYESFDKNGDALLMYGETMISFSDRINNRKDREVLNQLAEQTLRRAIEITDTGPGLGRCQYALAKVLVDSNRSAEAILFFEKSIAAAMLDLPSREERSLALANAFWRAGQMKDARALYEKLLTSNTESTRSRAKLGLASMGNNESEK